LAFSVGVSTISSASTALATPQLVVIAVDGDGSETTVGPRTEAGETWPDATFSPDGTKILATYPATSTTWMFDADGRNGRQMPLTAVAGASWQRQAP
jgi:hypothetical protein